MLNILETCDAVLANPEGYDYKVEKCLAYGYKKA